MYVFVYGTLTDRSRLEAVLESDQYAFDGWATLEGLHRVEGRYPTLAPGDSVDGRLVAVDATALDRLDAYEGVADGLYVRTTVPIADTADQASVYVGDPARLGVDDRVEWPASDAFPETMRQYLESADVVVRPHE